MSQSNYISEESNRRRKAKQMETFTCPDPPIPQEFVKEWEDFFRDVHSQSRTVSSLSGATYQGGLFPLQYRGELNRMLEIAVVKAPEVVMEIGCDKCAGLYHFCLLPTVTHVIGCEIRGTPFAPTFEKNFPDIQFNWCEASRSEKTLNGVRAFLETAPERKIDVLFIDGDKCFYTEDFDTYLPMMRSDGVVFMHDVSEGYPAEVFDKMKARGYRTEYIRDITDYHVFRQRGLPAVTPYENWLDYWKGTSCGVGVIYLDGSNEPKGDK